MNQAGVVLPEWLGRRAHLTPDVPALLSSSGTWTFRQLYEAAAGIARSFSSCELFDHVSSREQESTGKDSLPLPGPRIGLLMSNSPRFVMWAHGLAMAGAVLLPLNTRLARQELVWQLQDAGAAALVHDAAHAEAAKAVARDIPGLRCIDAADPSVGSGAFAPGGRSAPDVAGVRTEIRLDDLHSIVYTSGTTGRPKGAMLTYGNYWWSATASALNVGAGADDRWLACMPLFHVGGMSILLRSVIYGMPVLLHPSFDAGAVNEAIDEQGVTIVSVVATMLGRMLSARNDKPYPPTLRAVLVGGGPAPKSLLERALRLGLPVLQTYGLTEAASQVATLSPADALRKLGSAGKPLFPTRLRIVHDGGVAAPGEVGEITVAGPTITPGYWNKPEETAAVLRDGWLHTGDLGFVDEEGYVYVVERREDLIVSGGENVYPAEVEAILLEHADIAAAAVIGVPDERWGQVPAAAVVVRDGRILTEAAVQAHCRERLAAYKVPTRVVFVTELPTTATGKPLRRLLRNRLQHSMAVEMTAGEEAESRTD